MGSGDLRRTDLAVELRPEGTEEETGVRFEEGEREGIPFSLVTVLNEAGEKALGRPCGRYASLDLGAVWLDGDGEAERKGRAFAALLSEFAGGKRAALAVCLGNRAITADALGPLVMERLRVTRHLVGTELEELTEGRTLAAFAPGVVGQTGIETLGLVLGAAEHAVPDVVIAVDALAARSPERLCTTLQICDTGIAPGSGIGNRRAALNERTLGVPVIAIGVPTVADSTALILDALERSGEEPSEALLSRLGSGQRLFVSRRETDEALLLLSSMIADAVNGLFSCFS